MADDERDDKFSSEEDMETIWKELSKSVREPSRLITVYLGKDENGFGFNIRGGIDHPHIGCDPGIFITTVRADGAAGNDGRLKPGDRILAVNSTRLDNVSHEQAVRAFRVSEDYVSLLVEQGAEAEIMGAQYYPTTPRTPKSPGVGVSDQVDSFPPSIQVNGEGQHKPDVVSKVTAFFGTTAGALSLGIVAGSLVVFVGLRIYKSGTK
ncbi:predicted protein [Nematostella vectensis]|uniref:PDZ domain-containing protein n=1 Tax=Nematostella vectensis TaxID=45351 RepID=A7RNZ6_NEMVE|nr:protein lap4 isoform X2 [Nematostella vectensis]EDO46767.1 predicted protein [Nematostella vectensis]|eukprot:XP_001638830.1 predicted protein [Nematostella vectensis]